MALQDILKKILADADTEIENLQKQAEKAKRGLDEVAEKKEKKELTVLEKHTEEALASIETKIKSMGRREKAKIVLQKKREIVEGLLCKLQKHLESLEDAAYAKVIKALFAEIPDKEGVLLVPKNRVSVTQKNIGESVTVKPKEDITGGFIFKSKKGGVIDNSFQNLIHGEFRSQLEIYFTEQLKFI